MEKTDTDHPEGTFIPLTKLINNYNLDANEGCPGVRSDKAGKQESCAGCPN